MQVFIVIIDRVFTCQTARLRDLMMSESSFIAAMNVGLETFSRPARHAALLSSNQHRQLFQNVDKASIHRVSKNCAKLFCQNFVKSPPILIIFGRMMANRLKLCEMDSLSTSPNLRHHTTVLNADVPNCYTTL